MGQQLQTSKTPHPSGITFAANQVHIIYIYVLDLYIYLGHLREEHKETL